MSIFDGLIKIGKDGNLVSNNWIEWVHPFMINKPALKDVTFKTGWMVEPGGLIRCITPFGGWIK